MDEERSMRPRSEGAADEVTAIDEIPHLPTMLGLLVDADRLIARAVDLLVVMDEEDAVLDATGVGLNQWLTIVARRTTTDARMLRAAAKVCRRIPSLRAGFVDGSLSWAQVRAVALMCRRVPEHLDDTIDAAIAPIIAEASVFEPDAIVWTVRQALASIEPSTVTKPEPPPREFLAMQPRADGHGGQLFGEMGAQTWAIIDAALNTTSNPLVPESHSAPGTTDAEVGSARTDARPDIDNRPDAGQRRLSRLIDLLERTMPGGAPDPSPEARPGMRSRPQLLLRAELDTLLKRSEIPGVLLTRLLGGKVWMDVAATRRMVNERGADLRTVIVDTGRVVGVGRRTRVPPGWLNDAALALHDTCMAPGCDQPARGADLDHARPWYSRPAIAATHQGGELPSPGRTDIDQLAPVCAHHNRRKESDGWRVVQHADHTRTWTHSRTGLSTTTVPETWRPDPGRSCWADGVARERRGGYTAWSPSQFGSNGRDPCRAGGKCGVTRRLSGAERGVRDAVRVARAGRQLASA